MARTQRTLTLLSAALVAHVAACGSAGTSGSGASGTGGSNSSSTFSSGGTATGGGTTGGGGTTSTGGAPPGAAPYGCVTDVSSGHHTFPCGGIVYDVETPEACAAGGCGVVLDIPGYTSNADEQDLGTGLRALGQKHGYVVVQPTAPGIPPTWTQVIDNPKLMAFVSDTMHALVIDPKRIHAMGFSQGGGLVWGLVCGYADVFASASSLSAASPWSGGLQGCDFVAPNIPSQPIPILQVHGHLDNTVNFTSFALLQRDIATKFWGDGPGTVFETGSGYQATRYTAPDGTPYEFWEHDYASQNALLGHCFPGGDPVGFNLNDYGCVPPNGFAYGELAMEFFVAHPRP